MNERTETFTSAGLAVAVECFEPQGVTNAPTIVALHGSGGMSNGAPIVRAIVQPIVALGYSVYLPHYFERTGTYRSDPSTSRANFPVWMQTVADALGFAEHQAAADPARIGVIGISLGAFLGLSVATRDARVKVIVDFFGGLPPPFDADVARLPPTLVLHGDADQIVPVSEAQKLKRGLEEHSVPHEAHIYPREGHMFSPLTMLDAARRTMSFIGRWL